MAAPEFGTNYSHTVVLRSNGDLAVGQGDRNSPRRWYIKVDDADKACVSVVRGEFEATEQTVEGGILQFHDGVPASRHTFIEQDSKDTLNTLKAHL